MAILKFDCPHCRQPLEATDDLFGQVDVCPYCGKRIMIPRATEGGVDPAGQPDKARAWTVGGLTLGVLVLLTVAGAWIWIHREASHHPVIGSANSPFLSDPGLSTGGSGRLLKPAIPRPEPVATGPDEALFASHQVGPAPWRVYPPKSQNLPILQQEGALESFPPYILRYDDSKAPSRKRVSRLLSDPAFTITVLGNTYNIWAALEQFETACREDKTRPIPHFLIQTTRKIDSLEAQYGEADYIGSFVYTGPRAGETQPQKRVNQVYWFGVIFFIVGDNGTVTSIGGWPSRLDSSP